MPYSDLSVEELILLTAEFVGRGAVIPREIKLLLGDEIIWDIENPEFPHDRPNQRERPGHRPTGA